MGVKITDGRIKPKRENTFGQKKPFKGSSKNRKGNKKLSVAKPELEVGRVKPKIKVTKGLSVEEQAYLTWLNKNKSRFLCFCCGEQNGIEWHHVKLYSSDKKNHFRLIPLCGVKCHRDGRDLSAHGTSVKWRDTFPMSVQNAYADYVYSVYEKEMLCLRA